MKKELRNKARIERQEKMIKVTDNWHPNYSNEYIKVFLIFVPAYGNKKHGTYHNSYLCLGAWGADDYGLNKYYSFTGNETKEETNKIRYKWEKEYKSIPDGVNKEWFITRGFTYS